MFDFVRRNTKVLQFILFLLIFPSFVLFGVEGYSRMNDKGAVVARVDGRDIRQAEWDAAHKTESDRLRQQMPTLDAKLLDSPEARYATLERMVRDRVIGAAARAELAGQGISLLGPEDAPVVVAVEVSFCHQVGDAVVGAVIEQQGADE